MTPQLRSRVSRGTSNSKSYRNRRRTIKSCARPRCLVSIISSQSMLPSVILRIQSHLTCSRRLFRQRKTPERTRSSQSRSPSRFTPTSEGIGRSRVSPSYRMTSPLTSRSHTRLTIASQRNQNLSRPTRLLRPIKKPSRSKPGLTPIAVQLQTSANVQKPLIQTSVRRLLSIVASSTSSV